MKASEVCKIAKLAPGKLYSAGVSSCFCFRFLQICVYRFKVVLVVVVLSFVTKEVLNPLLIYERMLSFLVLAWLEIRQANWLDVICKRTGILSYSLFIQPTRR